MEALSPTSRKNLKVKRQNIAKRLSVRFDMVSQVKLPFEKSLMTNPLSVDKSSVESVLILVQDLDLEGE
jgi:hypothetical protein